MAIEERFLNIEKFKINFSFSENLTNLSDRENPIPLDFKKINIAELRNQLIDAGIDISLVESTSNLQESIKDSQFRNENQGKGIAVMAVLGPENYQKYFDWAMQESKDQPVLINGDESSKCQGLMQFLGETIALASIQINSREYCQKTNLRVGKKYQKNIEISERFGLPTDKKGLEELKKTSSIPKGSAIKAYEFILSLNK